MKIIVTGYKPFLKNDVNPTEIIANKLKDEGYETKVLDVVYKDVDEFIYSLSDDTFLLSLGLAQSRKYLSIEKYAFNKMNNHTKDNSGYTPEKEIIDFSLKEKEETNIKIDELLPFIKDSYISEDPGTYLCNYIYFKALNKLNNNALFIHLPSLKNDEYDIYLNYIKTVINFIENSFNN